jgi:hypothetical protein
MSYPKWLYHKTEGARMVNSQEAHEGLGEGWFDSPAEAEVGNVKKEKENVEVKVSKKVIRRVKAK